MSSSESSDENNHEIIPVEILEAAKTVSMNLLSEKSRILYTKAYDEFKKWSKEKGWNSFCEDIFLVYFHELATKYVATSLWATFSMLKATINSYNNINIGTYKKLTSYLKSKIKLHKSKKSKEFNKDNVCKFLNEAPDELFLDKKVILIFGIAGGLRRGEFVQIKTEDVVDYGKDTLFVKISKTKTYIERSFVINNVFYEICKKYINCRPKNCTSDRFFLNYSNGKCICQPIGINTFGSLPKFIASFLELNEVSLYTGHSFRHSSTTILADAGADLATIKRRGGWKSTSVAEGYITESYGHKRKISNQITSGIHLNKKSKPDEQQPSTSKDCNIMPLGMETYDSVSNLITEHQPKSKNNNPESTCDNPSASTSKGNHQDLPKYASDKDQAIKSVFHDQDIGLYVNASYPNSTFIFNNCNVTIQVVEPTKKK